MKGKVLMKSRILLLIFMLSLILVTPLFAAPLTTEASATATGTDVLINQVIQCALVLLLSALSWLVMVIKNKTKQMIDAKVKNDAANNALSRLNEIVTDVTIGAIPQAEEIKLKFPKTTAPVDRQAKLNTLKDEKVALVKLRLGPQLTTEISEIFGDITGMISDKIESVIWGAIKKE